VTRRSYELGRLNFLALAQTEQLLVDLRLAQLDAAARYHRALLDIERLTATSGVPAP
jgi:cobalt-zinc-cadmium efflux system outer membrane protein